ncbi:hypothetical protein AM501_09485 [Aneurinibacillus migulanus]|uniref:hypothetical protein n=1 Tax=Aneurinibacillus migulanus TaxID=47500 RepID=UPI0006B62F7E|nr:hypothetical protein [Aneurinibacillus migulanus]KPD08512.1 hypothetical protein AM501_09485 [Aneurinibacillus migulanus]
MKLLEGVILKGIRTYLTAYELMEVEPPFFVMLSLLNVKGYRISRREDILINDIPIDRQHLIIPEVVIEESFPNVEQLMRPIIDVKQNFTSLRKKSPTYKRQGAFSTSESGR